MSNSTLELSKSNRWHLYPEAVAGAFTQSEITTLDECGELWYRQYNEMLSPKMSFSWPLEYGSWIHTGLESWYASGGKRCLDTPLPNDFERPKYAIDQYDYYAELLPLQLKIYRQHYRGDFKLFEINPEFTERTVDFTFEGIPLRGLIDLVVYHKVRKMWVVVDHKTTGQLNRDIVEGWDFRFQFMFYLWLMKKANPDMAKKIRGIMPNAIRKPLLRQGKNETLPAFMQRIRTDMMSETESYFYRDILTLKVGDMDRFENETLFPKLQRLQILLDPKAPVETKIAIARNKNTAHCRRYGRPCEFFGLCKNGDIELPMFKKRKVKHEELDINAS